MNGLVDRRVAELPSVCDLRLIESEAVPPGTLVLSTVPLDVLSGLLAPRDSEPFREAFDAEKSGRVVVVKQAKE